MEIIQNLTEKGTFFLPSNISATLGEFDTLFYFILWLSVIFMVGLIGVSAWFLITSKRKSSDQLAEKQITHNIPLEIIWTVVPTLLVLFIFWLGFKQYMLMRSIPPNATTIYVSGKKWFWEFTYPNGKKTIGDLVVPVNTPVKLILSSTDVLHSFYLPNLRIKRDVIPNRYTVLTIEPAKIGNFRIFCTEYCGDKHSNMLATLKVMSNDDYYAFLKAVDFDDSIPLSEAGKQLYTKKGCVACHSIDGSPMVGPTWKNLYNANRVFTDGSERIADEAYLIESINYPQAHIVTGYQPVMPSYQGLLVDQEITAIIEYIKELSD
jgi:cytochrome c oxidase subunit 2